MKYNRLTRRMFLETSTKGLVAMPFLPSLFASDAQAAVAMPTKYVQFLMPHGNYRRADIVPDIRGMAGLTMTGGIKSIANSNVAAKAALRNGTSSGSAAMVFSDSVLDYVNFIRGVNGELFQHHHNSAFATTASFDTDHRGEPDVRWVESVKNPFSIDTILEQSTKFHGGPIKRAIRVNLDIPYYDKWYGSWSYTTNALGKPDLLKTYSSNKEIWDSIFSSVSWSGSSVVNPSAELHKSVTGMVVSDFNRLKNRSRISGDDKVALEQYMDTLSAIENSGTVSVACRAPTRNFADNTGDVDTRYKRAIDLLVLGLQCDISRVVSFQCFHGGPSLKHSYDIMHPWSHGKSCDEAEGCAYSVVRDFRGMSKWRAGMANYFLEQLKNTPDGAGGNLLDATAFLFAYEYASACANAEVDQTEPADYCDIPVIVAGKANGKLNTGQIIHFDNRAYNSVLVTLFDALGLEPADYERGGRAGFGTFVGKTRGTQFQFSQVTYDTHMNTDQKRRTPLPVLKKV